MASRNLELKCRCPDLASAARAVKSIGAQFRWTTSQTDTYFNARRGRLKLREEGDRVAELIAYARPDRPDARLSEYTIVPVAYAGLMKTALAGALGVRVVVTKRRTLYCWRHVRIHLDDVAGLGTFVELEAVITSPDEEAESPDLLVRLVGVIGLRDEDRVAGSYSNLLLEGG